MDVLPVNDLRRSWTATLPEVRTAVERVIASGRYIQGPEHDAFETELAAYLGVRYAAGVANGTDALVLALQAVGCVAGSEIVTAPNAGGYAASAAAQIGGRIVYADIDPDSLVVTPASVTSVLGRETRAVVVTHLYGNIADVNGIVAACAPAGIAVIEDCAQAIGGVRDGRPAGSMADVATLSFYPTKNLGGVGDGGAVVTNDPVIDATVRSLRQYGWGDRYVVDRGLGRNSRLDELQAAVLRVGLHHVDALTERRRLVIDRYRASLAHSDTRMVTGTGTPTVAHLAVVRTPERDALRARFDSAGVRTDIHYPVLDHRQPGLAQASRRTGLPEAEGAVGEIVTLPCFAEMTADEIDRVCDLLAATAAAV